ncbi:MAG: 50S ribosomal protein L30 [Spirochaetes bacterium DG_61]|nr:MAG: 50S ribosomal protein L30 [Spirochaetes bacterium DG_61]
MIKLSLVKSLIGVSEKQRRIVRALGLKKMNSTVVKKSTPQIQGMVFKVSHLVKAERVEK